MRPGAPIRLTFADGSVIKGQVWAEGDTEGTVWVALADGHYAKVWPSGVAQVVDAKGQPVKGGDGRVAA